jgi:subtilisin
MRPAWARDSVVLRLDRRPRAESSPARWDFADATGEGVQVAVIDSGVDADHPQLGGCVDEDLCIEFTVDSDGEVVETPGPHRDSFGHGTAVAGIIHGLAPLARITSVRVLGPNLSGKAAAFHAGLTWAVEQGYDVINLSLGTTRAEWAAAFHEICDRAYFGNSFVVTAANNVQRASFPSLFASVASVACNLSKDPWRYHVNPNPPTEFLARGIDIEVPWLAGGTTVTTGNSFAAPHIAGLAALLKSKHPDLRPFQIKAALWANAANVLEASEPEPAGRRATVMMTSAGRVRSTSAPSSIGSQTVPGYTFADEPADVRGGLCWAGTRVADGAPISVVQLASMARDDPSAVTVLRTDIDRLGSLGHPHVLPGHTVVDRPWIGIVTDRLQAAVPLDAAVPWLSAVAVAVAVCSALEAAGSLGLRGGLLSAEMLSSVDGRVVVHPLGLVGPPAGDAADVASLDPRQLAYVAPEVLKGSSEPERGDAYAVGVLLHRLITGRFPYDDGVPIGRYLKERLVTEAVPLDALVPEVPERLAGLIADALARDPARRPPTAGAMGRALLESAGADPVAVKQRLEATGLVAAAAIDGWSAG